MFDRFILFIHLGLLCTTRTFGEQRSYEVQVCVDNLGLWPLPSNCTIDSGSSSTSLSPSFAIVLAPGLEKKLTPSENDLIQKTIKRYNNILRPLLTAANTNGKQLSQLIINVTRSPSEAYQKNGNSNNNKIWPSTKDDETYTLLLSDGTDTANLHSNEIWGILRGIETFSQLFDLNTKLCPYSTIHINDFPRFQYRGLMLDTSRHYITMQSIQALLDGMF